MKRGRKRRRENDGIEIGNHAITLENGTPNTEAIENQLKKIEKGSKIGVLKFNGTFRVRMCGEGVE